MVSISLWKRLVMPVSFAKRQWRQCRYSRHRRCCPTARFLAEPGEATKSRLFAETAHKVDTQELQLNQRLSRRELGDEPHGSMQNQLCPVEPTRALAQP